LPALSSLSFGALRKAQQTLDLTREGSDAEGDSDGSYSSEGQRSDDSSDGESKQEDASRIKEQKKSVTAIAARKGKNM